MKVILIIMLNLLIIVFGYRLCFEYGWKAKDHSLYVVRMKHSGAEIYEGETIEWHKSLSRKYNSYLRIIKWGTITFWLIEIIAFYLFKRRRL